MYYKSVYGIYTFQGSDLKWFEMILDGKQTGVNYIKCIDILQSHRISPTVIITTIPPTTQWIVEQSEGQEDEWSDSLWSIFNPRSHSVEPLTVSFRHLVIFQWFSGFPEEDKVFIPFTLVSLNSFRQNHGCTVPSGILKRPSLWGSIIRW